jgi:hypothetical protein
MKRYYICEAVQYIEPVNGKSEKFAMVGRDTENEALIVYHDKMSAARKDENVAIEIVHVMDEKGGDIKTDCFEREIPQPEPEEETPEEPTVEPVE